MRNGFAIILPVVITVVIIPNQNFLNKCCIVLPPFIATLVLRHFHYEKRMHISPKQLSSIFGQCFFTLNLSKLCQDVSESCLHCVSYFFRNRSQKALGPERQFDDCLTPNWAWSFDTMYLPKWAL